MEVEPGQPIVNLLLLLHKWGVQKDRKKEERAEKELSNSTRKSIIGRSERRSACLSVCLSVCLSGASALNWKKESIAIAAVNFHPADTRLADTTETTETKASS